MYIVLCIYICIWLSERLCIFLFLEIFCGNLEKKTDFASSSHPIVSDLKSQEWKSVEFFFPNVLGIHKDTAVKTQEKLKKGMKKPMSPTC